MRYLLVVFLFTFLVSCHKDEIDSSVSSCSYSGGQLTRAGQFVDQVPATIIASTSSSQQVFYQIAREGSSATLSACNLPAAFEKDSLKVTVSGYFLTYPGSDYINISNLPFEVTEVRFRN